MMLLCCCESFIAQETVSSLVDSDYRRFRKVFNEEISKLDSTVSDSRLSFHPASLPAWLSTIPASNTHSIYTIGISDPGMEVHEAMRLAILRAKIIMALLLKAELSSITDNYTKENEISNSSHFVTKYVNYYRLLASTKSAPEQFQVANQYITSFGETIVLMKYSPSVAIGNVVDSLMLKIDLYVAERQLKNRFEFEEKCEMYGLSKQNKNTGEINIFYYFYNAVNQFYEIVSRFNGNEIDFPQNLFRYQMLGNSNQVEEYNAFSYKLTYGLWKAYLESILQFYTTATIKSDQEISQLDDQYLSSSQNISREIVETDHTFALQGLRISNNRLSVILKQND